MDLGFRQSHPILDIGLIGGWLWIPFVADGVFFAKLNEMLTRELAEDGYSGVEIRNSPLNVNVIIRATRKKEVLGNWESVSPNSLPTSPSPFVTTVLHSRDRWE